MAVTVKKIITSNNILSGSIANQVLTRDMTRNFGAPEDFVEMHVFDPAGKRLYTISNFNGYQIPGTFVPSTAYTIQELVFSPDIDLKNLGIQYGDYRVQYNVLRPKIVTGVSETFFIKEISPSRSEIRIYTNNVSSDNFQTAANSLINEIQSLSYFKEYYLNFGENQLLPFVNAALDTGLSITTIDPTTGNVISNPSQTPTLLIKLLSPLPVSYKVGDSLSIVDEIANPQVFDVSLTLDPIPATYPTLRGPNFDLDLDNLRIGPTPYYNFNQITSSQPSFGPLQQLLNQLSASNFAINIDYTDYQYENWIHFSSAARRLEGFKYKLTNIETYTEASSSASNSPSPISQLDAQTNQNKINTIIQSFDGWEQYLYYESGAYAWPKQNSNKPYINQSITASQAVNWYNGNYDSASLYDDNNQNYLLYTLPGYITENGDNELAFKFVASVGQMFDDIWIHIKALTDLYQAKNSLTQGISKDLVYFVLQSMGVDVYTDQDGTSVFKYLYGVNPDGSYLPVTSSYQTLVSASQYQTSGQDIQKGIYKRMYHSLPLLLKSKGTTRFIQYLNTVFGVPPTVMSYIEYGGVDKVTSSFEYEYDRYTYGLELSSNNAVSIPWVYTSQSLARTGFNDIVSNGVELRFKAFTTASNIMYSTYATQSLFYNGANYSLNLLYTDTGSNDSIYSGSTGKFGYLQFNLGAASITSSTVPVFETGSDGKTDWYSVLVQRRDPNLRVGQASTSQTYDIYIKNNVWGEIGHRASASLTTTTQNSSWYTQGTTLTIGGGTYPFSGSVQELRLWSNYVSESTFDSHVLNPESIEGNYSSSAYDDLNTRFTLGNNLYTYNHSVTTQVYSTHPDQKTQVLTASFANFPNRNNYSNFVETYYADVANSGYANPVTDKIRIYSGSLYGTQLLPNKSIEIQPLIPITKDIHLIDAGLSPQDEINKDIIAQLGSTYDLDNIIGDPRGTGYDKLEQLRVDYFKKYINKYNYKDYITLIEYFHNSLFRTLKDFTPARTNPATGIIIKNHLLERPAVDAAEIALTRHNNLSQSIDLFSITASNAMVATQPTYSYIQHTNLGPVLLTSDARDFFTGEFPSASIDILGDFEKDNFNPFAIGFNNDKTSSYSQSIWNVEYNPLLNNVEDNQLSNRKYLLTWIGGNNTFTSGSTYVTESFQYQDFTNEYIRHINPRYNGSTTTSQFYNIFSVGDTTFGKNAAIDKNTNKFAFFTEIIATGSDLLAMPERSNVYIKYLVDELGSLTELTKRNYNLLSEDQKYNLYQVQNIFKSGEVVNIGLFDYQNPTNQINLDGNKQIFTGGFRFHPMLWRTGSEDLTYAIDPNVFPQGAISSNLYNIGDFYIVIYNSGFGGVVAYIRKNTGTVSTQTNINCILKVNSGGSIISIPQSFIININTGVSDYVYIPSVTVANGSYITSVNTPGTSGQNNLIQVDTNPSLTISPNTNKTIISASYWQSYYYGGFIFTGSINGVPTTVDYPFVINPGDLLRLTSGSNFTPLEEYEIIRIINLPRSGSPTLVFEINKPVSDVATGSYNMGSSSIDKFIFSRKIPDETNIVIQHRKNIGETSAGIAKNNNLSLSVDANIANIVSELKNTIFATVLTS